MVKIDRTLDKNLDDHQACWVALKDVKTLAFDHNLIIKEAMTYIRQFVEFNPSMLFELLPRKFTAAQLRTLFEKNSNDGICSSFGRKTTRSGSPCCPLL